MSKTHFVYLSWERITFIVVDNKGEREIPATRLTIGNLPLSFSNEEISKYISKLPSVNVRSSLMEERARDDSGKLTHWKTGRRFVYIDVPSQPLPKTLRMGSFSATLYDKEQKIVTCSKCLVTGPHASVCTEPVKCRQCLQSGHKAESRGALPSPSNASECKEVT